MTASEGNQTDFMNSSGGMMTDEPQATGTAADGGDDARGLGAVDPAYLVERFRMLCNATNDALWDYDLRDGSLWWSEGLTASFGYRPDQIQGTLDEWLGMVHPDDRERVAADFDAAVSAGGPWTKEYRMFDASGAVRWVLDRGTVLRDDHGGAVRMLGGVSDVTERRLWDERRRGLARLEGLGTMAGGIAHNLGNVLAPIHLALDQLEARAGISADDAALLDQVRRSTRLASAMVGELLAFARGESGRRDRLDLRDVVSEVRAIVGDSLPADVEMEATLGHEPVWVDGDLTQLQQVLLNLVTNARDAMPSGGRLVVATDVVVRSEASVPSAYGRISVSDTGTGIDAVHLPQLFEPFFTTKAPGIGTGLGLPTSRAVVEHHGGRLDVDTSGGEGTTFEMLLPLADAPPADAPSPDARPELASRSGTQPGVVLVIEDESAIASLVRRVLESAGHQVLIAADGDRGLELLAASSVDAVITDLGVPGVSGVELVGRIREVSPGVPLVVASGGGVEVLDGTGADVVWLSKPFTTATLLGALVEAGTAAL